MVNSKSGALCATLLAVGVACGSNDNPPATAGTGGSGAAPHTGGSGNAPTAGVSGTTASAGHGASGGSGLVPGTGGSLGTTGGTGGTSTAGSGTSTAGSSTSTGGVAVGGTGFGGRSAGGRTGMSFAGNGGMPAAAGAATSAGAGGGAPMGTSQFTIKTQLASDVKQTAPTTVGIVTWSIAATGITEAHIDFGLDATYGMTAPVDLKQMDYRTLLLGMKPAKTYHFHIVASDGAKTYTSDDQTITTGAKSSANAITSFSVKNAAALTKGFFVTSFWQGTNSKLPFIFDSDGDVVWWYTAASGESTDGISQAKMSADGQSIWLVNESLNGAPLRRVTIDGLTTQTYSSTKASHALAAVSGDTMAYLDYSESDCNSIFEINNAGTTKEVFEPTGIVMGTSFPTCHGNAVRYSKKEDCYTYSDWNQDVLVVDRSGKVQWKLSQKVGSNQDWKGAQHGHQLLDNSILIFANNAAGMSQSQAIEYDLNGKRVTAFKSAGQATNFGDVQRLSNGNTVITYSTSSTLQIVDKSDAVVLEVKGSGSFGYVEFRESLYGLPIDIQQ